MLVRKSNIVNNHYYEEHQAPKQSRQLRYEKDEDVVKRISKSRRLGSPPRSRSDKKRDVYRSSSEQSDSDDHQHKRRVPEYRRIQSQHQSRPEQKRQTESSRGTKPQPAGDRFSSPAPSTASRRIRPRDESRFEPRVQELDDSDNPPMEVSRPSRAVPTTRDNAGNHSRQQKEIRSVETQQQKDIRRRAQNPYSDSDCDEVAAMKVPIPPDAEATRKAMGLAPKGRHSIPRARQQDDRPSIPQKQQQKDIPSTRPQHQKNAPSGRRHALNLLEDSDSDDFVEMKNPMLPTADTGATRQTMGTIPKGRRSIPPGEVIQLGRPIASNQRSYAIGKTSRRPAARRTSLVQNISPRTGHIQPQQLSRPAFREALEQLIEEERHAVERR